MFIHQDPEFEDLLRIVAEERRLALGLVEKDYWVTHALWAIHQAGFEVWFKGGTSLSKGFGLIQRFSEDLDLKIEPGGVADVPSVSAWRSEGNKAIQERAAYFEALAKAMPVPDMTATLMPFSPGDPRKAAEIRLSYPGRHLADLAGILRPFVLLEVGNARVTPHVSRSLSSFVQDYLDQRGLLGEYEDNRPQNVRCVHPLVTLIEKLDALAKRAPRREVEPASFVRHYEDAFRIIQSEETFPALECYADVRVLALEMLEQRQIRELPHATQDAFAPLDAEREAAIQEVYDAISPMYWGERVALETARAGIRAWLEAYIHPA